MIVLKLIVIINECKICVFKTRRFHSADKSTEYATLNVPASLGTHDDNGDFVVIVQSGITQLELL